MALQRWRTWAGLTGINAIIDALNNLSGTHLISNSVTNAVLAEMAAATVKGRASGAGTGAPTDLTSNQLSTILDTASDPFVRTSASSAVGERGRVRVATTADITISTALNNGDTLDGVTLATGDLVLVKNQSSAAENGVYVVGASPARSGQYDSYDEHPGVLLTVMEGTANADTLWLCTSNKGGTINSTALAFAQITSGSGNAISSTSFGSEPGSPASGDLDLYSSSFYLARYNSGWQPWGPIWPMTIPPSSGWSWVNQGTASIDTTPGAHTISAPATAPNNLRLRTRTAAATPYTITAAMLLDRYAVNYTYSGVFFRDSASGKLHTFGWQTNTALSGVGFYRSAKFTNATTFSADYSHSLYHCPNHGAVMFLRIADDGTNRICSVSHDGYTWIAIHSVGRTDFLTADEIGFFVSPQNLTFGHYVTLLSWS